MLCAVLHMCHRWITCSSVWSKLTQLKPSTHAPALSLRNTLQPQHSEVIRRRGTPLISMSVHNFVIIHPIAVEIFQFGQKLTDSWLTHFHGWNHNHQQKEDSVSLSQRGFDRRLFPSSLAFTRDSTIIREAIRGKGALWTSRGSSKGQQTNREWDMIQKKKQPSYFQWHG